MTGPCLPFEELLALAEGPRDDPRWDHVRGCARCRSRLTAYGLFTALGQDVPRLGEDQAVARLAETLQSRIGPGAPAAEPLPTRAAGPERVSSTAGPESVSPPRRPERSAQRQTPLDGLLQLLRPPRILVPALGVAAILVGIVLIVRDDLPRSGRTGSPVMREEPTPQAEATVSVFPARPLADGSLELRWTPVVSADAYCVRILDPGLQETARLDAGTETQLVLPVTSLRAWSVQAAFWQVEALIEGDRIADSAPAALPRISDR